jgi:hypothetical protein
MGAMQLTCRAGVSPAIIPSFSFPGSRLGKRGSKVFMKNLNNNNGTNGKQERAKMKSLSLGIVSNISRLLVDKGFGQKPLDIVEALFFAMFIIADTYSLAKPEKDHAIEVINGFYDDMQNYFINKVIIDDHNIADTTEIQSVSDQFYDLSRGRFAQYGEKFKEDISDPMALSCPTTVSYLLDNLFIQSLNNEEKIQLMGAVSDKVLYLWAGCVQKFK